jgi:hypothetical protein
VPLEDGRERGGDERDPDRAGRVVEDEVRQADAEDEPEHGDRPSPPEGERRCGQHQERDRACVELPPGGLLVCGEVRPHEEEHGDREGEGGVQPTSPPRGDVRVIPLVHGHPHCSLGRCPIGDIGVVDHAPILPVE